MSLPAIEVSGLSKRYVIERESRHDSLRDTLHHSARKLWRRLRWGTGFEREEFWALRDVSFSIQPGEVVGIIGRNGAGKSTLLKILSRITEPTAGQITLRGRVASLLEVGTGFHPDLSGRENIYLNGAILGMQRAEIRKKFDEIVAFAEVERFLDTPVKRYSSGMYVRLAFAVAAHLEPEILIVDEVLAVGDAQFQKKCLGKMQDVARNQGRTVLFVSHDLNAMATLTNGCLWLQAGQVGMSGPTREVIGAYLSRLAAGDEKRIQANKTGIERVEIECSGGGITQWFGEPMRIRILLAHPQPIVRACLSLQILDSLRRPVTHLWIYHDQQTFADSSGKTELVCDLPKVRLNVGNYHLRIFLSEPPGGREWDVLDGACNFEVLRRDQSNLWGWRPDTAAYFEENSWTIRKQT